MRVALAAVFYSSPHLMVLDEPSNHLDLEGVECLAAALQSYTGAVLLVSHDQVSCCALAWLYCDVHVRRHYLRNSLHTAAHLVLLQSRCNLEDAMPMAPVARGLPVSTAVPLGLPPCHGRARRCQQDRN